MATTFPVDCCPPTPPHFQFYTYISLSATAIPPIRIYTLYPFLPLYGIMLRLACRRLFVPRAGAPRRRRAFPWRASCRAVAAVRRSSIFHLSSCARLVVDPVHGGMPATFAFGLGFRRRRPSSPLALARRARRVLPAPCALPPLPPGARLPGEVVSRAAFWRRRRDLRRLRWHPLQEGRAPCSSRRPTRAASFFRFVQRAAADKRSRFFLLPVSPL